MDKSKFRVVPEDMFQALIKYLSEKPFKEVGQALPQLSGCKTLDQFEKEKDNVGENK